MLNNKIKDAFRDGIIEKIEITHWKDNLYEVLVKGKNETNNTICRISTSFDNAADIVIMHSLIDTSLDKIRQRNLEQNLPLGYYMARYVSKKYSEPVEVYFDDDIEGKRVRMLGTTRNLEVNNFYDYKPLTVDEE